MENSTSQSNFTIVLRQRSTGVEIFLTAMNIFLSITSPTVLLSFATCTYSARFQSIIIILELVGCEWSADLGFGNTLGLCSNLLNSEIGQRVREQFL